MLRSLAASVSSAANCSGTSTLKSNLTLAFPPCSTHHSRVQLCRKLRLILLKGIEVLDTVEVKHIRGIVSVPAVPALQFVKGNDGPRAIRVPQFRPGIAHNA
jgi:hypothetical protein